ncbi:hypothetical protein ZWY2020_047486 [Hordeum vulgare]|nr:hypothetical protein ZWY2020_047486 [Hordeum vulgare]
MAGLDQPLPIAGLPLGNFGYAAPEYGVAASELAEKVDTYSFGVLMLELVTGRMANEAGADGHLATWARNNFTKLMVNQQEMFQSAVDRDIPIKHEYGVAASELAEKVDTYSFGVLMLELTQADGQ